MFPTLKDQQFESKRVIPVRVWELWEYYMCHCSGISASLVRESSPHHDSSPSAECLPHKAFTPNRKANCKTVRHAKTRLTGEPVWVPSSIDDVHCESECGIHPSCTECRSDHTLHARMLQSARWSHSIVLLIRHQSSDISQAKVQVADTTHFDFHRHTFNLYDLVGVEEGHLAEVKIHLQLLLPTLPVRISLKVRCMHLLSSAFADSRSVWKRTNFQNWNSKKDHLRSTHQVSWTNFVMT